MLPELPRTPSRTLPEHCSRTVPNPGPNGTKHTLYTTYTGRGSLGVVPARMCHAALSSDLRGEICGPQHRLLCHLKLGQRFSTLVRPDC